MVVVVVLTVVDADDDDDELGPIGARRVVLEYHEVVEEGRKIFLFNNYKTFFRSLLLSFQNRTLLPKIGLSNTFPRSYSSQIENRLFLVYHISPSIFCALFYLDASFRGAESKKFNCSQF